MFWPGSALARPNPTLLTPGQGQLESVRVDPGQGQGQKIRANPGPARPLDSLVAEVQFSPVLPPFLENREPNREIRARTELNLN